MNDRPAGTRQTNESDELQALRLLLGRLGVSAEQLLANTPSPAALPTFDEYIDKVSAAVPDGSR